MFRNKQQAGNRGAILAKLLTHFLGEHAVTLFWLFPLKVKARKSCKSIQLSSREPVLEEANSKGSCVFGDPVVSPVET